jgi:hypothetical protein
LYVAIGDNDSAWRLARRVGVAPPAWKPLPAPQQQVLAFASAANGRVRIAEVDSLAVIGQTPPGPAPREIWWAQGGRQLVTVAAGEIRVHGPRGRLLRRIELPRGSAVSGSALGPAGKRLAVVMRAASQSAPSRLLTVRLDRGAPPRLLLSLPGAFEGLSWSMDGSVLVVGRPAADEWLFVRPGARVRLVSARGIRKHFEGGVAPRRGEFPRPAGWCYAEPENRTASGQRPCLSGSAP